MRRQALAARKIHERLVGGFLVRFARSPDAGAFALRGGVLVRHWAPGVERVVNDVDLLSAWSYDASDLRSYLRDVLACSIDDGVRFDAERFRLDAVWAESPHPGLRLFARGRVDSAIHEITADFTFNVEVWPHAEQETLSTPSGRALLAACRPEMVLGTKLRVIGELGPSQWRPKDLSDILTLLRRFQTSPARLFDSVERAFEQGLEPRAIRPSDVLGDTEWWHAASAHDRWASFVDENPAGGVSHRLEANVEELRARLAPIWNMR